MNTFTEFIRELERLFIRTKRTESKVDSIIEMMATDPALIARIRANAEKLSASSDELKEAVDKAGAET